MSRELFAVTGASGFVGRAVVATLRTRGIAVRPLVRQAACGDAVPVGEIGPQTDWARALHGVTHVIHAAARAHVMQDDATDPLEAYRTVNVDGTRRLAEQAAVAGVRRLVFVSSVKVNGERTPPGAHFSASDRPAPEDAYGLSKWEAEQTLHRLAVTSGFETVVIRPPLVYGPGAKGNFARLINWVRRGVPLPLGAINNRRALVGIDNLVDLLVQCTRLPQAVGQTFMVSDGNDLSTPELISRLALAMGRRDRVFHVYPRLLGWGGQLTGRSTEISRLTDSLCVNLEPTRKLLCWSPPLDVDEGLRRAVESVKR